MAATVREILRWLDGMAPFCTAEEWDNVGLLVGDPDARVTTAAVSLDPSREAVEQAAALGAQLLVSHHPVIFRPIDSLTAGSPAYELARRGIAAIAAHTNLDAAAGGVNDALAAALGLADVRTAEDRLCRIGRLPEAQEPRDFAREAARRLGARAVQCRPGDRAVSTVALCSGAGGDYMAPMLSEADAFVTGELSYHGWPLTGTTVIAAGHFHTEIAVVPALAARLREAFPSLRVEEVRERCPYETILME